MVTDLKRKRVQDVTVLKKKMVTMVTDLKTGTGFRPDSYSMP